MNSVVPFNFLVISISASFGLNDTLVASFVLFSLYFYESGKLKTSGLFLGLSVLLKFYPLVIIPFLIWKDRRFVRDFFYSLFATTLVLFSLAYWKWGVTLLQAFDFSLNRDPKYFSPLGSWYYISERQISFPLDFLLEINSLMMGMSLLFIFIWFHSNKVDPVVGALLGLFTSLIMYKGSSEQYFLVWVAILALLLVSSDAEQIFAAKSFLLFSLFLSFFALGYEINAGYFQRFFFVREYSGVFIFVFGIFNIFLFLRQYREFRFQGNLSDN